jgi:hypothetical protein
MDDAHTPINKEQFEDLHRAREDGELGYYEGFRSNLMTKTLSSPQQENPKSNSGFQLFTHHKERA